MLQAISPDYLFYKIGEKDTDSVLNVHSRINSTTYFICS